VNSRLVEYDPWFDGFTRGTILEFASVGVYPPTLAGKPRNPEACSCEGLALMDGRDLATCGCSHDPHGDRTDLIWLARQRAVFAPSGCTTGTRPRRFGI
jgi:hypothetical protein